MTHFLHFNELIIQFPMLVLGIEGSANKVGVGIIKEDGTILANPRRTYGGSSLSGGEGCM